MKLKCWTVFCAALLIVSFGCGKKGDDNFSGGGSGQTPALTPVMNLSGAVGLLVTDPTQQSGSSLVARHNDAALKVGAPIIRSGHIPVGIRSSSDPDGTSSLVKTDTSGTVSPVITVPSPTPKGNCGGNGPCGPPPQQLPMVSTIAVSPIGEVFVQFAQPFRYVDPDPSSTGNNGGNMWSDGTYCQIFRVKGGTVAELQATPPTSANLECMDNQHFIQNYNGTRSSVFQFDAAGNAYYPGQLPNSPVTVVYKWNRATGSLTEMVNANICVSDFLVTPSGGLFYTGMSCKNMGGGGSGGFFRYVSNGGVLTQIAQDWWNFIYEPESTAETDKAVFYGPDPNVSSVASWNTACLFYFDPTAEGNPTTNIITCGNNIWSWVNMQRAADIDLYGGGYSCLNGWGGNNSCKDNNSTTPPHKFDVEHLSDYVTEYSRRCSSTQSFAGGGSQISAIKEDSSGGIYVIGNVQIKAAGTFSCSVQIKGPHCLINSVPDSNYTTKAQCLSNAGATWSDQGNCNNWYPNSTASNYNNDSEGCLSRGACTNGATPVGTNLSNGAPTVATTWSCPDYNSSPGTFVWNTFNRMQLGYNGVTTIGSESTSYCSVAHVNSGNLQYLSNSDFNNWSDNTKSHNNIQDTNAADTVASSLNQNVTYFNLNNVSCQAPSTLVGSNDGWTQQYIGMAKVNKTLQQLDLVSSNTEQALRLFVLKDAIHGDKVYYSSFDTSTHKYYLKYYDTTGETPVIRTMKSNFEVYNLNKSGLEDGSLYFDGLNFADNSYTFGTIQTTPDGQGNYTVSEKTGLTGTLKTIVYLADH